MYKITLLFESDVKGVYTKEEETATDEYITRSKFDRMVDRWASILVPHIQHFPVLDVDNYFCSVTISFKKGHECSALPLTSTTKTKLYFIHSYLEMLNKIDYCNNIDCQKRRFSISITNA
jgi:hypothetical protein